jgi:anti-sigma28 factor (negative regulator of flagellin synthesis)
MRISGSGLPQGVDANNSAKPSQAAKTANGSEQNQTADLLALSKAAASALSSNADRVQQLKLEVSKDEYSQPSTKIAQGLISNALSRGE